jgi:hypothetical protein
VAATVDAATPLSVCQALPQSFRNPAW